MPWPHLPADFRERNRSVWVDADSRLYDPVEGHRLYHEYLDQLEFAERVGFDGLVLNEHHQHVFGLMPSPQLMAAALARRTSRAAIILLGMSIALYRPATRAAEEIAMLDVISGGRIVAGFPLGTPMDANFAYGANPAEFRRVYREHHDLILRAWQDPDVFAWNGESAKLRYVNIWPRPVQQPHPPVWIPADGISSETWDFCAERSYAYVCLASRGIAPAQSAMDGFWSRVDARGLPWNPYQGVVSQTIVVADSDAEAQERYQGHLDYTSRHTLGRLSRLDRGARLANGAGDPRARGTDHGRPVRVHSAANTDLAGADRQRLAGRRFSADGRRAVRAPGDNTSRRTPGRCVPRRRHAA